MEINEAELTELRKTKMKYDLLEEGWEYQDFIMKELMKVGICLFPFQSKKYQIECGESLSGIEVKYDKKMSETGNIFIETASATPYYTNQLCPSGIFGTNCFLYIIGDKTCAYMFSTAQLKFMAQNTSRYGFKVFKSPEREGFLISTEYLKDHPTIIVKKFNFFVD